MDSRFTICSSPSANTFSVPCLSENRRSEVRGALRKISGIEMAASSFSTLACQPEQMKIKGNKCRSKVITNEATRSRRQLTTYRACNRLTSFYTTLSLSLCCLRLARLAGACHSCSRKKPSAPNVKISRCQKGSACRGTRPSIPNRWRDSWWPFLHRQRLIGEVGPSSLSTVIAEDPGRNLPRLLSNHYHYSHPLPSTGRKL